MIDRHERLQIDIDCRIRDVWNWAFEYELDCDMEMLGHLLRAAYGQGYVDAHTEAVPMSLYREHGYRLPKRAKIG